MKKLTIIIMSVCMMLSTCFASNVPIEDISEILCCMGIIEQADNTTVTRGELAEIIVKSSEYSNMVTYNKISPFSDVSYDNEYAPYIRVVANNGIMTGYYDGEFKPERQATYEEIVTAILKLLGYTSSDFTLGYPYSQLKIANDIGLTDDLNISIGSTLRKKDLAHLIYNALSCNTKDGRNYATVIDYKTTNGNVTLSDAMDKNAVGPITLKTNEITNLNLENPRVYVNGNETNISEITKYDIFYYSLKSNTIWAYNDRITGVVEKISPNKETPTSVKVSNITYNLTTYSAQKAFGIGGIETGNIATLLLDRNGQVADAYLTEELYKSQIGVIINAGKKEVTVSTGDNKINYYATVLLVNGETIDIATSNNYSSKIGYAAKITYSAGYAKIYSTSKSVNIYGKVDIKNKKIGDSAISSDIKILEYDEYGNTIEVSKDRIDGVYISKDSVSYTTTNENGEINTMLIKNVTGDTSKYSVIVGINKNSESETYKYLSSGESMTYSTSDKSFGIEKGPVAMYFNGQTIEKMKNLTKLNSKIVSLNSVYLETSDNEIYKVSENVFVCKMSGTSYEEATMEDAIGGEYNITAYYDSLESKGGRIRVIYLS